MSQAESARASVSESVKCDVAAEVLRSFGTLRFTATGWSMLPTIFPGEVLVVERLREDQVVLGDVILVGRDGRLCAHRVIAKSEDRSHPHWLTQGDAMPTQDLPVTKSDLLGRVTHVVRGEKQIALSEKLSVVERLIAKTIRRYFLAARLLVYAHRIYAHKYFASRAHLYKGTAPCQQ